MGFSSALLFAFFGSAALAAPQASCPSGFTYTVALDTCLSSSTQYGTWAQANLFCSQHQSSLLSIHDDDTNAQFARLVFALSGDHRSWLGLQKDAKGDYAWTDGTPLDYQNFRAVGSGDCFYLESMGSYWAKADCTVQLTYYCSTTPH
ncbi:unnamed protein product, partial [Mesorhabditis belari]|uniref:C-type lectin domain-containing protein n=1 Tax=Mesorhabditis belari TaxID=2138241 RepID=A0AAF3EKG8_9BILA